MVVYAVVVVLITVGVAYNVTSHNLASALKLASTQTNESFTELYFTKPGQLPTYAAPGKEQTVDFRIVNDTLTQHTYRYVISISVENRTSTTVNEVVVRPKVGVSIPFSFSIPRSGEQAVATVGLMGSNEQLFLRSHS